MRRKGNPPYPRIKGHFAGYMPLISARQVADSTVIYNFLSAEIDQFDESAEVNSGYCKPQNGGFQYSVTLSNNESNHVYDWIFLKK